MTAKWRIRRVAAGGVVVWRLSCAPLGVRAIYWSWDAAISHADYWSKHAHELGWRS